LGYLANGEQEAYFIFGAVFVPMLLQFFIVYRQNVDLWAGKILLETAPVILGVTSVVDAFRVSNGGHGKSKRQNSDDILELSYVRCSKAFAESIPSLTFQIYILLKTGATSSLPTISSIVISAVSAAFALSALSYDLDVDPENRANNPNRYGYVPNSSSKRAKVFLYMFTGSLATLFLRTWALAMLLLLSKVAALLFVVVDVVSYLGLKAYRKNLQYFLPGSAVKIVTLER